MPEMLLQRHNCTRAWCQSEQQRFAVLKQPSPPHPHTHHTNTLSPRRMWFIRTAREMTGGCRRSCVLFAASSVRACTASWCVAVLTSTEELMSRISWPICRPAAHAAPPCSTEDTTTGMPCSAPPRMQKSRLARLLAPVVVACVAGLSSMAITSVGDTLLSSNERGLLLPPIPKQHTTQHTHNTTQHNATQHKMRALARLLVG